MGENNKKMAALIISFLALIFWVILGHIYGSGDFAMGSLIFYPLLFILLWIFIKPQVSSYISVPFCFLIIYLNACSLRLFGSGDNDDVGIALQHLFFGITLLMIMIFAFFIMHYDFKNNGILINPLSIFKIISYITLCSFASIIFYIGTAKFIYLYLRQL